MLDNLKKVSIFVILLCPEGIAILLVCSVMELIYRASISLGFSNDSLEYLSLGFGVVVFVIMFTFRLIAYFVKKNNKPKKL